MSTLPACSRFPLLITAVVSFARQMQLERLLARQMEILQDAAVQERLQALDWRIPPAALKYLTDIQNTNGAAAEASRDNHGG